MEMRGCPESWYSLDRTPSESFVNKLTRYDSALSVRWNHRLKRWEIWRKVGQKKFFVMRCHFPNLDNRILRRLWEGDLWRYGRKEHGRCTDIWNEIDAYNDAVEKSRERETDNLLRSIAYYELYPAAKRAFGNPKSRMNVPVTI
jgi:hypothetical protein